MIFDMDGVLLDSEPLHYQALSELLASEGHSWSEEDNRSVLGTTVPETFRQVSERFHIVDSMDLLIDRYDEAILRVLSRGLEPAAGVRELLDRLRARQIPVSVASSSRRSWITATLRSLKLDDQFEVVVSGDDVVNGKPAPDIYLLAAERMGVTPKACLAIEDAPNGIASAKAAGMKVVAVRTPYTEGLDLGEADVIVDDLTELDPLTLLG